MNLNPSPLLFSAACFGPPYPTPEFQPRATNVTVTEGESVMLPCAIRYLGAKKVSLTLLPEGDHTN